MEMYLKPLNTHTHTDLYYPYAYVAYGKLYCWSVIEECKFISSTPCLYHGQLGGWAQKLETELDI